MAWTPLRDRIDTLPVIICGPILRRVEKNNVSVWIATRKQITGLILQVLKVDGSLVWQGRPYDTIQLGNKLFVAVVSAPVGPVNNLQVGVIYKYNIILTSEGGKTLKSPGIISPDGDITNVLTYGEYDLPTFVLPASDINNLNIFHGSCRKPHGGKVDALSFLDQVLAETYNKPASERPQQLFMTGDQIYADDVAETLMYMLEEAASTLLGWDEAFYTDIPASVPYIAGYRKEIIATYAQFADNELYSSHLIMLGEFYCMYLFTWSDVLWHPTDLAKIDYAITDDKIRRNIPNESQLLGRFRRTLPKVRRILANISVYMMFDDHDITDDWFINAKWTERVLASPLGGRIVQNGVTAFTIFQAWGNTPKLYETQYAYILETLTTFHRTKDFSLLKVFLPYKVDFRDPILNTDFQLEAEIDFSFRIRFDSYLLIALDTRTRRAFSRNNKSESAAALLSSSQIDFQLSKGLDERTLDGVSVEIAICLCPAPFFGHSFVEEVVQKVLNFKDPYFPDFEAWSFYPACFHYVLKELSKYGHVALLSGDVHYSFSFAIQYWNSMVTPARKASIIQLTSSSLSNCEFKSQLISGHISSFITFTPPMEILLALKTEYVGWENVPSFPPLVIAIDPFLPPKTPLYVVTFKKDYLLTKEPDFQYRVSVAYDERLPSDRGMDARTFTQEEKLLMLASSQQVLLTDGTQRVVVGKDSIGQILFRWGPHEWNRNIEHYIWQQSVPSSGVAKAFTRHITAWAEPDWWDRPYN